MRPKTPNRIHPRRLLLKPNGSPVPSVLILSSTRAMAGLDIVAAHAAASSDALIPTFVLLSCFEGFSSIEHLTFPFTAIAGNPRTGDDEATMDGLCTRTERVIDDVPTLAVMAAIFLGVGRRDGVKNEPWA